MTAACHHSQYGLIAGHAYTMLGVNIGVNERNEETRYIVVRNPWGKEQYTGPGSDQDNDGKF